LTLKAAEAAMGDALERATAAEGGESVGPLGGRAPDVLGTRALWSLANVELDAVTLAQIREPLAIHRTLVEKVVGSSVGLDEPKPFVDS
jgi:hypothetical protein